VSYIETELVNSKLGIKIVLTYTVTVRQGQDYTRYEYFQNTVINRHNVT
jgi:hypothetical protein